MAAVLPEPGVVYVLASLKHPGVVKIGRSARGGARRAAELANVSGYRGFAPFALVGEVAAPDAAALEGAVHRRLRRRRVRLTYVRRRELFRADATDALALVEEVKRVGEERRAQGSRPAPPARQSAAPPPPRRSFEDRLRALREANPEPPEGRPAWWVPATAALLALAASALGVAALL